MRTAGGRGPRSRPAWSRAIASESGRALAFEVASPNLGAFGNPSGDLEREGELALRRRRGPLPRRGRKVADRPVPSPRERPRLAEQSAQVRLLPRLPPLALGERALPPAELCVVVGAPAGPTAHGRERRVEHLVVEDVGDEPL